jgi:hypothetical protein
MDTQLVSPIFRITPRDGQPERDFGETLGRGADVNNASNRTQPNSLAVVAALTAGDAGGGPGEPRRIGPDSMGSPRVVAQVTVSESQLGNASDASGGGATAVVVTTDVTGEQDQTTVITVTEDAGGDGSQIAIDISAPDGSDTVTTVTIDSKLLERPELPGDARVAFGILSNDAATGDPRSLILIVPTGSNAQGDSTFNIVTVQLADAIDPALAFQNYGFSGLSAGNLGSSFGGAVALDVNGSTQIVWVNAGRNISPSFTGEIQADYGTINPANGGNSGTVAGLVGKVTLVFEKGVLIGQKDSSGAEIGNFNSFIREQIAAEPIFPQLRSILSSVWKTAFSRDTMVYALTNVQKSRVFSRLGDDSEQDSVAVRQAVQLQQAIIQRVAAQTVAG